MKKQIVTLSLLTVFVLAGSIYAVHADPLAGRMLNDRPGIGMRDGSGGGRFLNRMARVIDLTEAQKSSINAILDEEQAKVAPLRQQMAEYRDQLHTLMQANPLDEAAVRTLAEQKAAVSTELTLSRARTQNRILAQLTPEQRDLAEKVRPLMRDHRGGRGMHRNVDCYSRFNNCPNNTIQ